MKNPKRTVLLVANGDLRQSANQTCWPAQLAMEQALTAALAREYPAVGRPTAIIAHTIKGRGVSFMEDDNNWHYRIPSAAELAAARAEIAALRSANARLNNEIDAWEKSQSDDRAEIALLRARLEALETAADPFSRALNIIDKLPVEFRPPDNSGLRDALPRVWPTIGEFRALRAAIESATKPL